MPSAELAELVARLEGNPEDASLNYEVACAHDREGLEHEAVPYYLKAISAGLDGEELRSAYLGLGSTYRAIGQYEEAVATFDRGLEVFPDAEELLTFRAMALHNLGRSGEAMSALLTVTANHTSSRWIERYRRAILFYADHLDETW